MPVTIHIPSTVECTRALLRDSVPNAVIDNILGKTLAAEQDGGQFVVHCMFAGEPSDWRIAAECAVIVTTE